MGLPFVFELYTRKFLLNLRVHYMVWPENNSMACASKTPLYKALGMITSGMVKITPFLVSSYPLRKSCPDSMVGPIQDLHVHLRHLQ
jgi:hypothetical protein